MRVSKEQIENWVAEAVDSLPEKFRERIHNLEFFVENEPTKFQLQKARLGGKRNILLFGLYEGYHQSKRMDIGPVLPDRITIFKKPIESFCETEEEIKRQIVSTVRHEIAHHFGSDEKGAQKAGRGKERT